MHVLDFDQVVAAERVKLVAGLTHFGTRHPVVLAGMGATMQALSANRFVLAWRMLRALGATEIELIGDSELVARQLSGAYKVKHPAMRTLYEQTMRALREFDRWSMRTVPRAQNAHADALVNQALDAA